MLLLLAMAMITYGVWLISVPAGWITGGVLVLVFACVAVLNVSDGNP